MPITAVGVDLAVADSIESVAVTSTLTVDPARDEGTASVAPVAPAIELHE